MVKKTRVLHVKLTEEEYITYRNNITEIGETLSRFTRKLVRQTINGEIDLLMDEQAGFKIAIRQLVGMANNLNQITAAIHAGVTHHSIDESYLLQINRDVVSLKNELIMMIQKTTKRWIKINGV